MNESSWTFWQQVATTHRDRFDGRRVVEVGSLQLKGQQSIGQILRPIVAEYTGVDWIDGPNVDLVSVFHEVGLAPESFDAVVSSSALEHDGYLDQTVTKMDEVLRPGGSLFLCWAGARYGPHCRSHDPTRRKKYYRRPAEAIVRAITDRSFLVDSFFYKYSKRLCFLIAYKPTRIDDFISEDCYCAPC